MSDNSEQADQADLLRRENRLLEERIGELSSELEIVNKELESYTHMISHDFKAPLRSIDGYLFMLMDDFSDSLSPAAVNYIHSARKSAIWMSELIRDFVRFSQNSRKTLNKEYLYPAKIAYNCLKELSYMLSDCDCEVIVEDMPRVYADRDLLRQVYINLISNAIKFTNGRKPAIITIGSYLEEENRVYFVEDNGTGFDMKYKDQIFQIFSSLDNSGESGSTGVGLAIAKKSIDRHKGSIWVRSAKGKGTTFFFSLPGLPENGE